MKTLDQHTLIYDKDCPMCRMYTKAFIRFGMMDQQGRTPFHEIDHNHFNQLDADRARNEIALVNTQTQQVTYGLDSLLTIIGHSFPALARIARFSPLYYGFKRLYAFVSYNRKQIIPHREEPAKTACIPDFRLSYRIAYIIFATLISVLIFYTFSDKLRNDAIPHHRLLWTILIYHGPTVWQTLWLKRRLGKQYWDYIGNMMTVSLIGTLLLIPALYIPISSMTACLYLTIVAGLMLAEHYRRCRILSLGTLPLISWMIYQAIVLGLLFFIG